MLVPRKVYRVIQAVTVLSPRFRSLIFTFKRVTWSFQKKGHKELPGIFVVPVQAFQLAFFSWGKNLLKFDFKDILNMGWNHTPVHQSRCLGPWIHGRWGMELDLYAEGALPKSRNYVREIYMQRILYVGDVFKLCFIFTPIWGRWTHFDEYFSDGLKPSRWVPPYLPLPSWHMSMVRLLDTSSPCPQQVEKFNRRPR